MTSEINLTPTGVKFEIKPAGAQTVITGRSWGTASESKAACLLIHGMGAHSGWFEAFARRLKVKGIYAMAYDQLGFGARKDQKFTSGQQWLNDVKFAFDHLKEEAGNIPVFIMGNSMGAVVALSAANRVDPQGLVLLSPGFDGYPGTFSLMFRLKAIFNAFFSPETEIEMPYSMDLATREESARIWTSKDPEKRFSVPASMLWELTKLTGNAPRKIDVPLFVFTAGVERIVNNEVTRRIYNRIQAPNKRMKAFTEAWHDLMFDPEINQLVEDLAAWMEEVKPKQVAAT